MPTFKGNPFSNFFKRILQINQSSNTGVDATTRNLQTGDGVNTAVSLSDDVLKVQPQNDDTTGTFVVANQAGNSILSVDTTNSKVLTGASQYALNTQYVHFGVTNVSSSGYGVDTWYAVPFVTNYEISSGATLTMGTANTSSFGDTNPASSLTISTTAHQALQHYWYVPDNITVDAVHWLHSADAATGDVTKASVMAYDIDTDNGSTGGDLSNGTLIASSSNITNAGYEQIYYNSMSISSSNINAGKLVLFCFASDTNNSDFTISATIKYHLR